MGRDTAGEKRITDALKADPDAFVETFMPKGGTRLYPYVYIDSPNRKDGPKYLNFDTFSMMRTLGLLVETARGERVVRYGLPEEGGQA